MLAQGSGMSLVQQAVSVCGICFPHYFTLPLEVADAEALTLSACMASFGTASSVTRVPTIKNYLVGPETHRSCNMLGSTLS